MAEDWVTLAVSIHAPRGRSDSTHDQDTRLSDTFQSTLPVGGATNAISASQFLEGKFQSTLPVGGATVVVEISHISREVSIHAPRGRSDYMPCLWGNASGVSIHAPRGRSDTST